MTFLLDTHVLLYWHRDQMKLSRPQMRAIGNADGDKPLLVSDFTLLEIATLYEQKRLRLDLPLRNWLDAAVAPPLVKRCAISPAVAAQVAALPTTFHRDPADRVIVATAIVFGATLLTNDEKIIDSKLVPTL